MLQAQGVPAVLDKSGLSVIDYRLSRTPRAGIRLRKLVLPVCVLAEEVEEMTTSRHCLPEYLIAGNPKISPCVLERLANHESHAVRVRVAENPGTPQPILRRLANDNNPEVRMGLATNPSTP